MKHNVVTPVTDCTMVVRFITRRTQENYKYFLKYHSVNIAVYYLSHFPSKLMDVSYPLGEVTVGEILICASHVTCIRCGTSGNSTDLISTSYLLVQ